MITLEEAKNLTFVYDDNDPDGIELWGVLKCENPDIFVRLRKTTNYYVGFGKVFVVHYFGKKFGFITEIDDERALSFKRDNGTFVWVFRHMCCAVQTPDRVNGKTVARHHGGVQICKLRRARDCPCGFSASLKKLWPRRL